MAELDKVELAAHILSEFPLAFACESLFQILLDMFNQCWGSQYHDVIYPSYKYNHVTINPVKIQARVGLDALSKGLEEVVLCLLCPIQQYVHTQDHSTLIPFMKTIWDFYVEFLAIHKQFLEECPFNIDDG